MEVVELSKNTRLQMVLMVAERERDLPENKESIAYVVTEAEDEP